MQLSVNENSFLLLCVNSELSLLRACSSVCGEVFAVDWQNQSFVCLLSVGFGFLAGFSV